MKRQCTEWKNVFVNYVSDKWLISQIYKELIQLKIKQTDLKCGLKNGRRPELKFLQPSLRHTDGQQT